MSLLAQLAIFVQVVFQPQGKATEIVLNYANIYVLSIYAIYSVIT